jgi:hypothetical protein
MQSGVATGHFYQIMSQWPNPIPQRTQPSRSGCNRLLSGGRGGEIGALGVMRYLPLVCMLCLFSCGEDRISQEREARLQPVIRYMDAFIKKHHRLPTQDEFRADTHGMDTMLVLKDHTDKYAVSKGAKSETDYMVGCWRADWYHYYKSWDNSFLNGSDEF